MERIRVIGLEKSFGIRQIFANISFELKYGERLGLVGPNGAGKSTLLKCMLGLMEHDGGQVILPDQTTIGYLQQDVNLGDESLEEEIQKAWEDVRHIEHELEFLTKRLEAEAPAEGDLDRLARLQERMEWLGGYDYERSCRKIAFGLGFTEEDLNKKAHEFSGGQKTRINLAKALVRRPDYLFLDEPTNHLDVEMLEWLENYLSAYRGGILIVSHDRYFLDKVATGIIELEHHKAQVFKGNYSRYVQQKDAQRKAQQNAYDKQQEYIRKTEAYIDKYRAGIKSKMARGRQSQLNRLERLAAPEYSETLDFAFPEPKLCADRVLQVEDMSVGYGDTQVLQNLSLQVRRGEAIALIGPNGAGKSTLVKAIIGDLDIAEGHIALGNRVSVGYFSQEHEELHDNWQVVEEIMNHFNFSEAKARSVLGMFLFRGDEVFQNVGELSGGERARLALLKLFLAGDNFLVLDEPTNHLDIPTREIVEEALLQFNGTYLVISHDRYFLDKIAHKTLVLENSVLTEYLGNYSYYKEKLQEQKEREALLAAEKGIVLESDVKEGFKGALRKTLQANEVKEDTPKKLNSFMREKRLEEVETEIARLEATIKMYETQLNSPTIQENYEEYEKIAQALTETEQKLEKFYSQWENLTEE